MLVRWGKEFRVPSLSPDIQTDVKLTVLPDGRFVAVWHRLGLDEGYQGTGHSIRYQIFNADGSRQGPETLLFRGVFAAGHPQVATLANGHIAITWEGSLVRDDPMDVYVQVIGSDGQKIGATAVVNPEPNAGHQNNQRIVALSSGSFLVTWTSHSDTGPAVMAQMVNAMGQKLGATITLPKTDGPAEVAALPEGGFVVLREGAGGIHARFYDGNGQEAGTDLVVNGASAAARSVPHAKTLANGLILVTWIEGLSYEARSIKAQLVTASGSKVGGEFALNTSPFGAEAALEDARAIGALPDGRFVAAWTDRADSLTVRAQVFDANGAKHGAEFEVASSIDAWPRQPSITVLPDGRFVIGWEDVSLKDGAQAVSPRAQIFDIREAGVVWTGSSNSEQYGGTVFADNLNGSDGSDILYGYDGSDRLTGGLGIDRTVGGKGNDIHVIDNFEDVVVELAGEGIDTIVTPFTYVLAPDSNVENLQAATQALALRLTGNHLDNVLTSNDAFNTLEGGTGNDTYRVRHGSDIIWKVSIRRTARST